MGRSRGGFTSKVHLSADGPCRPLSLIVTRGSCRIRQCSLLLDGSMTGNRWMRSA